MTSLFPGTQGRLTCDTCATLVNGSFVQKSYAINNPPFSTNSKLVIVISSHRLCQCISSATLCTYFMRVIADLESRTPQLLTDLNEKRAKEDICKRNF